jgi:hypothetical protein
MILPQTYLSTKLASKRQIWLLKKLGYEPPEGMFACAANHKIQELLAERNANETKNSTI